MLRITTTRRAAGKTGGAWVLTLEGKIHGEWVKELRRAWRRLRETSNGVPISVVLADVDFVDSAGKVLLAEMHRDGIDIVVRNGLAAMLRDEITGGSTSRKPATTRSKPRRKPGSKPKRR
jgi:hypothetical protein